VKVRFLADANLNQKIVAGLLLREPLIDFALPQAMIPERMKDPDVLDLAHFFWPYPRLARRNNHASLVRPVR
jgi:hypothetical protein